MIKAESLLQIFKALPLPAVILLPDAPLFTVADANCRFVEVTGKEPIELRGQSFFECLAAIGWLANLPSADLACCLGMAATSGLPGKVTIDKYLTADIAPVLSQTNAVDYLFLSLIQSPLGAQPNIPQKRLPSTPKPNAAEQKYEKLFLLGPMPKLVFDMETLMITEANEMFIKKYGYSREALLKMQFGDFMPDVQLAALKHAETPESNSNYRNLGTFTHFVDGGMQMYLEVSGSRFKYRGRDSMMVVFNDVTEREIALMQLKDNQQKLLAAQNIAKIGYWKLDVRTQQLFWSDEVYKIFGVQKSDFAVNFESFFSRIHPDDQEDFLKRRNVAIVGDEKLDTEFRIVRQDGTTVWVHEKGKLITDDNQSPATFEGTIQDITESKLLKVSLQESNQRYKYVTRATFDAIWDWNVVTDKSYWGEGFERTFGYDLSAIRDDKDFWSKHIHPEDYDQVTSGIQASIRSDAVNWNYEYRFQKADGSYVFVMDKCIIIRDKNGKAVRLVGAMQDISEKKTLQQLLDKANRLAKIGSWEIDVPTATVYWSDITKEIRETGPGYEPTLEDGIGHFREGHSRDTIIAKVKESIEFGTSWQEDLQIYTHKGNLKWIRTTGKAELRDGKCLKIYGSFQDIDDSKKAELEIVRLYEEKNAILDSIGDGFFTVDKNWTVTYWNREAEKMLSIPNKEILGKNLWDVFSGSLASHSYKKYQEAIQSGERVFFDDYYPFLDKWFGISAYPSSNGLSVYFKDITDRILAQIELNELNRSLQKTAQELAVSNAELEQFAYIASHDLQEPLRMITSFLAQIEKKYGEVLDDKGKQYIRFAVDGARRMRQIILDLLEFSRVGNFEGKQGSVDVTEIVEEVVATYGKQIDQSGATIIFKELPVVRSFKGPLRQVFQNLVGNALKYQEAGFQPVIAIEAVELPDQWKFMVKDNGIGIEPEYYERIFNIFQRLHNKEDYSGTGIGLAIVKKIVEAMGGKIAVGPNTPRGSIFSFTISK